ncbi:MAG TPA: RpiB/LacA/LacB family sugar-phosphate isomerase [Verrucomicrobiae bacterium]|nr:RpiB/LacA/LacB family sugar-phosphate isomerase [Verrucomicrobiae bacterium]
MRIAIASDEAAQQAKERLITKLAADGHEVTDSAPMVQGQARVDYAEQVALSVLRHDAERGIIVSSRGVGASVAANRVPGVRAALCNDAYSAHIGAKTEGMNVLVLALHSLGENMAEEVVAAYLDAALAPIEVVGGLPPRRLQRVFSHIRENIARDLSVAELAQTVGMSQYYFSKLFKMSTGTTPHQYVMRQRVERAQEVLRETRTALAEVATIVGFETQSHFTSVFRRLVGATPKHYREMHQNAPISTEAPEQAATAA